jgi:hypothetical protein
MRRALLVVLSLLLLGVGGPVPASLGQTDTRVVPGQGKAKAKAKKALPGALVVPSVSAADMDSPYSALVLEGVSPAGGPAAGVGKQSGPAQEAARQSNATSWKQDLTLVPKAADDGPLQFHVGREKIIDPLTGKELNPKADPLGAKERLKELDLKGAVDKVGGKAEVQVDLLKF